MLLAAMEDLMVLVLVAALEEVRRVERVLMALAAVRAA